MDYSLRMELPYHVMNLMSIFLRTLQTIFLEAETSWHFVFVFFLFFFLEDASWWWTAFLPLFSFTEFCVSTEDLFLFYVLFCFKDDTAVHSGIRPYFLDMWIKPVSLMSILIPWPTFPIPDLRARKLWSRHHNVCSGLIGHLLKDNWTHWVHSSRITTRWYFLYS